MDDVLAVVMVTAAAVGVTVLTCGVRAEGRAGEGAVCSWDGVGIGDGDGGCAG